MEERLYCGIDLHKSFSAICIMSDSGRVVEQRKVYHSGKGFQRFFEKKKDLECVVEPVENWGWAVDTLQRLDHGVHLANTYKVRLIADKAFASSREYRRLRLYRYFWQKGA